MGFPFFPVMPMGLRWAALRAASSAIIWHGNSERTDWFFHLGGDFATRIVSLETDIAVYFLFSKVRKFKNDFGPIFLSTALALG